MSDGDGIAPNAFGDVNCYSDDEGAFMRWNQDLRGRVLKPALRWFAEVGLRANHVTMASLLAGLAFVPLFISGESAWALGMLALHVFLDGLDGPLARFTGRASNRGSFTDTMADQLVVTLSTLALIDAHGISAWAAGLYVFLYALVVGFAMVRNALSAPYSWLFRPRFLIYTWIAMDLYLWAGSLEWVLWGAIAVLGMKAVTGFISIRRRI
jgi:phosphatidylglycerophosphate synthase